MDIDNRIKELHLELPPVSAPKGLYKSLLIQGDLVYLSGHLPYLSDGSLIAGKVGKDLDMDEAKLAARQVGLNLLATMQHYLGSLNRIERVVKILGLVNSTPEFDKHPYVINGCSELMAEVFGDDTGVGTRSAFGAGGLPANGAVEIEAVFALKPH